MADRALKSHPLTGTILDSLNDGLYVCNLERRITYWSKAAERITGWSAEEILGRRCMDDILQHVDKDGRHLCGEEFCPLYRCMVTGQASASPVIVFGRTRTGQRIPMTVSVAPLHDGNGEVIGGVETFHDFSEAYANLERAERIQSLSMEHDQPVDDRIRFNPFYRPHDMIGGDYFAIRRLDADRYAFFLADVMGHGVAAALHTMHLSSLWCRYCHELDQPARFARSLNRELCRIVRDESFATALCGVLDVAARTIRFASAGGPPIVRFRPDGQAGQFAATGLPFGMIDSAAYDEGEFRYEAGDSLLMFTDGAIEIDSADGRMLGADGLVGILQSLGYPRAGIEMRSLEEALLAHSNAIRLDDDLTLLEFRLL